jgi:2-methylisocitrate lyase-like PEP mutase family enzyme
LLQDQKSHFVLGTYDALSARIGESLGYEILSVTGFGVSASLLGVPDIGLVTMHESAEVCGRICDAVSTPVLADADTGYGNALNVRRTVRRFEAAGAAGLHLEDQVTPKRCGHMEAKQVVSADEMVGKIGAAVDARVNDDFCIVARTDACAVEGLDAALERAVRYHAAGADVLFVEAPQSFEEIERIAAELPFPLLFNWSYDGLTPHVQKSWLEELGYKLVLFPDMIFGVQRALLQLCSALKATDSLDSLSDLLFEFDAFNDFVGLPEWLAFEARFIPGVARGDRRPTPRDPGVAGVDPR